MMSAGKQSLTHPHRRYRGKRETRRIVATRKLLDKDCEDTQYTVCTKRGWVQFWDTHEWLEQFSEEVWPKEFRSGKGVGTYFRSPLLADGVRVVDIITVAVALHDGRHGQNDRPEISSHDAEDEEMLFLYHEEEERWREGHREEWHQAIRGALSMSADELKGHLACVHLSEMSI